MSEKNNARGPIHHQRNVKCLNHKKFANLGTKKLYVDNGDKMACPSSTCVLIFMTHIRLVRLTQKVARLMNQSSR
jgi:hypothetical protein